MIRLLSLIIRNQWAPESSDRKGHRGQEVEATLWGKAADAEAQGQSALPMRVHERDHHQGEAWPSS